MCNAFVGVGRGALSGALARHTALHRWAETGFTVEHFQKTPFTQPKC
jgi:hypothetical protein